MEDKDLWVFTPTVVHGDMHEDNLLVEGERVVAVTGWTDLHIGDPAADLSWLIASPDQGFSDAVLEAYRRHRSGQVDDHILRRAALSAEFALAQWLVRGKTGENQQMVDEALGLLRQLAADIEAHGGRPIALTPMEGEQHSSPADTQDSKPVRRPGAAATIAGAGGWSDDDDDAPAVITEADVAEEPGSQQTLSQATGADEASPAINGAGEPGAEEPVPVEVGPAGTGHPEDPLTEELPAYVDDASEFETAAVPTTGSLPIQPDARSEQRAKQKNFFPSSAASASSARSSASAQSAQSAGSTQSVSSAASSSSAPSANSPVDAEGDTPGEPRRQRPVPAENPEDSAHPSGGSIYDRHPGLRPPGG